MGKIILKGVLGLVIGVLVYSAAAASAGGGNVLALLLLALWGIGFVYAFLPVMGWIKGVLNATLKITVISFLSCGTGILGQHPRFHFVALFPFLWHGDPGPSPADHPPHGDPGGGLDLWAVPDDQGYSGAVETKGGVAAWRRKRKSMLRGAWW